MLLRRPASFFAAALAAFFCALLFAPAMAQPAGTLVAPEPVASAPGRPLHYLRLTSTPHEHSARDSVGATLDWIAARFAGGREPNDCRRL